MVSAAAKAFASRSISLSCVLLLLVDLGVAAEERLLARRSVHDPVAELVPDREAAAAGPLPRLLGVHPDLARAGEQEPGERLSLAELGRSRSRASCHRPPGSAGRSASRRSCPPGPAVARRSRSTPGPRRGPLRLAVRPPPLPARLAAGEEPVHLVWFLRFGLDTRWGARGGVGIRRCVGAGPGHPRIGRASGSVCQSAFRGRRLAEGVGRRPE